MFNTCFSSPLQQELAVSILESARRTAHRMVNERRLRSSDFDDFASELSLRLLHKLSDWDEDRLPLDIYLSYCTRHESRDLLDLHRYNMKALSRFTSIESLVHPMEEWFANNVCPSWKDRLMPCPDTSDFIQDLEDIKVSLSKPEQAFLSLLRDHSVFKAATLSGLGRKRADQLLCELRERLAEEF